MKWNGTIQNRNCMAILSHPTPPPPTPQSSSFLSISTNWKMLESVELIPDKDWNERGKTRKMKRANRTDFPCFLFSFLLTKNQNSEVLEKAYSIFSSPPFRILENTSNISRNCWNFQKKKYCFYCFKKRIISPWLVFRLLSIGLMILFSLFLSCRSHNAPTPNWKLKLQVFLYMKHLKSNHDFYQLKRVLWGGE